MIELTHEELAALERTGRGFVRRETDGWHIDGYAPLRIYRDGLSNIPQGAIDLTLQRVFGLNLLELVNGEAFLTDEGLTALATGIVPDASDVSGP